MMRTTTLGMEAKKALYEGGSCSNGALVAESLGMNEEERIRLNVIKIKC